MHLLTSLPFSLLRRFYNLHWRRSKRIKHLSYRQFKNIFGDLGVTAWTKFNWLSNGLPDGEYNGIKKVTITELTNQSGVSAYFVWTTLFANNLILPSSNNIKWEFGFSNYEIKPRLNFDEAIYKNTIAVSDAGAMAIALDKHYDSLDEVNAYLKEHPIVLYYYDKNEWGGYLVNAANISGEASYFFRDNHGQAEIRDVQGEFSFIGIIPSGQWTQLYADLTITPSIFRIYGYQNNVYFDDGKYNPPGDTDNRTNFKIKHFTSPRAIVYRLSATQSLSLQSEDETTDVDSDIVVI